MKTGCFCEVTNSPIARGGVNFPADKIQNMICSKAGMESFNKLDEKTRRYFNGLFGWNLFMVTSSSE